MTNEPTPPAQRLSAAPTPLNDRVHERMSRMPNRDTRPELTLRRELHRRGLRFRVNYREIPGTPDIALTRARIAVFVDGCFWHRCPIHCRIPRNNRDWWRTKLDRNVARDRQKDDALTAMGWIPVHYWEHDDVDEVADEIEGLWRELRG
ncbi:MAG: very short patch repair endonuclease [Corynebacterium variabile]|uniref:very short patch repair endonuclease n=1 Tax=Corynebacterium variabile TaxID=1727 RepID=UPI0026496B41|nr:very short patch repair endonuclease [Corynebacterium variabile]MDN6478193.1 very short patch repair endonuclease [Corynebacterium variabile]MDN6845740.1 very short patch repair endonuclease [Corynebacterium variabile]